MGIPSGFISLIKNFKFTEIYPGLANKTVVYKLPDFDQFNPNIGDQLVVGNITETADQLEIYVDTQDVVGQRIATAVGGIVIPVIPPNMGYTYIRELLPTNPQEGETWLEKKLLTVNSVTKLNQWASWIRHDGRWVSIEGTEDSFARANQISATDAQQTIDLFVAPPDANGFILSNLQIWCNVGGLNNTSNYWQFLIGNVSIGTMAFNQKFQVDSSTQPTNTSFQLFPNGINENYIFTDDTLRLFQLRIDNFGNPGALRVWASWRVHRVRKTAQ
jgi:hypothetical protein